MATKRMYSSNVIDSDPFLDLPMSAQLLYFHLGMKTDDDGFVLGARRIARYIGASEQDIITLVQHGFLIEFPSKVYVITHFLVNNSLKNDRYHQTIYQKEYHCLGKTSNNEYYLAQPYTMKEDHIIPMYDELSNNDDCNND